MDKMTMTTTETITEAVLQRLQRGPARRTELIAIANALGFAAMSFERAVRKADCPIRGYKEGSTKWYCLSHHAPPALPV